MGKRIPVENNFTKRLKVLREETYDWNKSRAASECGLSASLYWRYEIGEVEPTLSNILKLMKGFRVDFETLIGAKTLNVVPSGKGMSNVT